MISQAGLFFNNEKTQKNTKTFKVVALTDELSLQNPHVVQAAPCSLLLHTFFSFSPFYMIVCILSNSFVLFGFFRC